MAKNKKLNSVWRKLEKKIAQGTTESEIVGELNSKYLSDKLMRHPGFFETDDDSNNNQINKILGHVEKYYNNQNRDTRYERLENALMNPEIEGVTNIYSDEITTQDIHGNIYNVFCKDEKVKIIIKNMIDRIGLEDKGWQINKNTCIYGDEFFEILFQKDNKGIHSINWLPREIIGRVEKNGILQHFVPREGKKYAKENPYDLTYTSLAYQKDENKDLTIDPFRILHWRINSGQYAPYGTSVLMSILPIIEKLKLMESAMMIARIMRAPERRIFEINVGNAKGESALAIAKQIVHNLRKKRVLNMSNNNELDSINDFFGNVEDIVVPRRTGEDGHRIDTLPQLAAMDISDIEFLRDRLFPGVGVPRQYLFDDTFANANVNLSNKSQPFAKKMKRLQKAHLFPIYKLSLIELRLKGIHFNRYEDLIITMNNPSNLDEREKINIENEKWTLITTVKSIITDPTQKSMVSDYHVLKDFLNLSETEILEYLKFNAAQQSNMNPFLLLPEEDRPEGWQSLDQIKPTPVVPVPGEEGGEIPTEVTGALGAPPEGGEEAAPAEPETAPEAETLDIDVDTDGKEIIVEDDGKSKAIKAREKYLQRHKEIHRRAQTEKNQKDNKYTKPSYDNSYIENSGELNKLNEFMKDKNIVYNS